MTSRRDVLTALAAAGVLFPRFTHFRPAPTRQSDHRFRIRAITAGITLRDASDHAPVTAALDVLERARQQFLDAGYEVQTTRIATNAFLARQTSREKRRSLTDLKRLDDLVAGRNTVLSLGPVHDEDGAQPALAEWTAELVSLTQRISFSLVVASPGQGIHRQSLTTAAEIMVALGKALPGGVANFRFAAAANIPPGTPFFPVALHDGPDSLALGLESPRLLNDVFAAGLPGAGVRLEQAMAAAFGPIERLARDIARREGRTYLGIDTSPAPGLDSSIGEAIETLSGVPFGGSSTLDACAIITAALKNTGLKTCGYAGLMLPVLEDPVLAQRASERRYGMRELLLYSSVCGTGLDVVPIPGDTRPEALARLIGDMAALSVRLQKPLSARLFLVPGKVAGDLAHFEDPLLTDAVVFPFD